MNQSLIKGSVENPGFYTLLSSLTAAVGLATNSPATIIGSMLLSPIGDIIVKLAIIGSYNIKGQSCKEIFRKNYFEKFRIPSSIVNVENQSICINKGKNKYEIEFLVKIDDDYYIKYKNDNKLYDSEGNSNFSLIKTDDKKFQQFLHKENERIREYKWYEYILPFKENNEEQTPEGIKLKQDKEFKILTTKKIIRDLKRFERQEIMPWNNIAYAGRKYKFFDIFLWGIFICFIAIFVGWICGIFFKLTELNQRKQELEEKFPTPTKEMTDRSKIENAIGMIFIAICSGIILPEAVQNDNSIRLVGISIATALLPPLVNIGLYLGILTLKRSIENPEDIKIKVDEIMDAVYTGILIFVINFGVLLGLSIWRFLTYID